jgi:DinB superfamily
MTPQSLLKETYELSKMVLRSYISDFSDEDLLLSPGEGCNCIAWQLGHLIQSECGLLDSVKAGSSPSLPAGFAETHSKAGSGESAFLTKQGYLDLADQVQVATFGVIDSLTASDLDAPSPENYRKMFPTVGSMLLLIATHSMMHAGQLVPLRRLLKKPVVI